MYQQARHGVVGIEAHMSGGRGKSGTGFVVSKDPLIVTNYHVIDPGTASLETVLIVPAEGPRIEARILATDEQTDLVDGGKVGK